MKRAIITLGIIFLGHTTIANAATDWTPYLKPMLSGCNYPDPTKNLPSSYKTSIVDKQVKIGKDTYDIIGYKGDKITTYSLKNATAFGQPLLKVQHLQHYEGGHLKLYFKDTKFTALRPRFKLPTLDNNGTGMLQVRKNDANGYEVEDDMWVTYLKFDRINKTITCS